VDGLDVLAREDFRSGAINAACLPTSVTAAAANSATTVLPDPTSPCSSRSADRLAQIVGDRGGGAFAGRMSANRAAHR
jgi:hypothetical protein